MNLIFPLTAKWTWRSKVIKQLVMLLALVLLAGCSPLMRISSSPSGATFYGGKTLETVRETSQVTPVNQSGFVFTQWESWCYKVAMEGYRDSEIICRPDERNRVIHFELEPIVPVAAVLVQPQTAEHARAVGPPGAENYGQLLEQPRTASLEPGRTEISRLLKNKPYPPKVASAISDYAVTRDEDEILLLARRLMDGNAEGYAVKPLILALKGKKATTRAKAVRYLGDIGVEAKTAVPLLENVAQHDLIAIRRLADDAIRKIRTDEAVNSKLEILR
jgi:hypothetical protein